MSQSAPLAYVAPTISQQFIDKEDDFREDLEIINLEDFDPRLPSSWGFTIYRAVFGHGTDTRFTNGLNRLEKWMRWETRDARYRIIGYEEARPEDMPAPGEPHITDEIATRMHNEVVEEYPDAQDITTEPEGSEDFNPVARDFISRVNSFERSGVIDLNECLLENGRRYVRYDTCLIIDERVLKMLEGLPEDPPEVVPRDISDPEKKATEKLVGENWIWALDRETAEQIERFKKQPRAPKRGLPASMFFANEHREKVREENPDFTFVQLGKLLMGGWNALDDEQRAPYEVMATADQERCEQEYEMRAVEKLRRPPWVRVPLRSLRYLFFQRAHDNIPYHWPYEVDEDQYWYVYDGEDPQDAPAVGSFCTLF